MPFSNEALQFLLTHLAARKIQIRLHTGDPGAQGSANLVATRNGYTHQVLDTGDFTQEGTTNIWSNTDVIDFGTSTGTGWGTISHYSLWRDNTDPEGTTFNELVARRALAANVTVTGGAQIQLTARTVDLGATSTE